MVDRTSIIDRIDDQMGLSRIIDTLQMMPDRIRAHQELTAPVKEHHDAVKQELDSYEAVLMAVISTEVSPINGKPVYSNAETRKAELVRRAKDDPTHRELLADLMGAKSNLDAMEFEDRKLYNEFSALRSVADLMAKKLALMASIYALPA